MPSHSIIYTRAGYREREKEKVKEGEKVDVMTFTYNLPGSLHGLSQSTITIISWTTYYGGNWTHKGKEKWELHS